MFTNWMPVSLRIPIPAEAKLAPTKSLCPFNSGLKQGNAGLDPIRSPTITFRFHISHPPHKASISCLSTYILFIFNQPMWGMCNINMRFLFMI